jgi:hypothetical protein
VAAFGYDPGYDTSFRLSSTTTGSTTDWSPTSSNDTYVYFRDTAPREPAETLAEMLRRTRGPGGHYWYRRLSGYTQDEYREASQGAEKTGEEGSQDLPSGAEETAAQAREQNEG